MKDRGDVIVLLLVIAFHFIGDESVAGTAMIHLFSFLLIQKARICTVNKMFVVSFLRSIPFYYAGSDKSA